MIRCDYCLSYLLHQNMINVSEKDIMLLYRDMIIRLLHAYDIAIPLDK